MKYRAGFVSNSSSSSFVIPKEKFNELLLQAIISAYNLSEAAKENGDIVDMNDILYTEETTVKEFSKHCYSEYHDHEKQQIKNWHEIVVVSCTEDNSIPWPIQEFLENVGYVRFHFG